MNAHVLPRGDLIEHLTDDDCPCGPTVKPYPQDDGSYNWMHVHHSLDNREASEAAR